MEKTHITKEVLNALRTNRELICKGKDLVKKIQKEAANGSKRVATSICKELLKEGHIKEVGVETATNPWERQFSESSKYAVIDPFHSFLFQEKERKEMVELFLTPPYKLLAAYLKAGFRVDDVEVAKHVAKLTSKNNQLIHFVTTILRKNLGDNPLREDGKDSWFISVVLREYGKNFIKSTLTPALNKLRMIPMAFEIDESKTDPFFLDSNRTNFAKLILFLLQSLLQNVKEIPQVILQVLLSLFQKLQPSDGDTGKSRLISTVFFLRFYCPLIISPEAFLEIPDVGKQERRILILLSKTLQSLVSGQTSFDHKEHSLNFLTNKVEEHSNLCSQLIHTLISMVELQTRDDDDNNNESKSRELNLTKRNLSSGGLSNAFYGQVPINNESNNDSNNNSNDSNNNGGSSSSASTVSSASSASSASENSENSEKTSPNCSSSSSSSFSSPRNLSNVNVSSENLSLLLFNNSSSVDKLGDKTGDKLRVANAQNSSFFELLHDICDRMAGYSTPIQKSLEEMSSQLQMDVKQEMRFLSKLHNSDDNFVLESPNSSSEKNEKQASSSSLSSLLSPFKSEEKKKIKNMEEERRGSDPFSKFSSEPASRSDTSQGTSGEESEEEVHKNFLLPSPPPPNRSSKSNGKDHTQEEENAISWTNFLESEMKTNKELLNSGTSASPKMSKGESGGGEGECFILEQQDTHQTVSDWEIPSKVLRREVDANMRLSKNESSLLSKLKKMCEETRNSVLSDAQLLRFIRAFQGDLKGASRAMGNYRRFYKSINLVPGMLTIKDVASPIASGLFFVGEEFVDKEGRMILFHQPSKLNPNKHPHKASQVLKVLMYLCERVCHDPFTQYHGVTVIVSLSNWSFANFSKRYVTQLLKKLLSMAPLRVHKVILVDAPSWFKSVWSTLAKILPSSLKNAFLTCNSSSLSHYVDPSHLPTSFQGGQANLDLLSWVKSRFRIEAIDLPKEVPVWQDENDDSLDSKDL